MKPVFAYAILLASSVASMPLNAPTARDVEILSCTRDFICDNAETAEHCTRRRDFICNKSTGSAPIEARDDTEETDDADDDLDTIVSIAQCKRQFICNAASSTESAAQCKRKRDFICNKLRVRAPVPEPVPESSSDSEETTLQCKRGANFICDPA